jgi:hypothetical protein
MPYVTCPSCGERGKIPPSLIGARIKCKKCSVSFQVSAPVAKVTAAPSSSSSLPTAAAEGSEGIEVEGLDASSWSLSTEPAVALKAEAAAEPDNRADSSAFAPASTSAPGPREYKLLTPKDKFFDARFDLARLEEALNHFARKGWTVKAVTTPHIKGFSGAMEETIVVLLER